MNEVAIKLMSRYHVMVRGEKLSVIASYKAELYAIADEFNLTLIESADSASKLTVWGSFVKN